MSFRELSAWVMGTLMIATGLHYLAGCLRAFDAQDGVPTLEAIVPYAMFVATAAIVLQVVLAIFAPKGADHAPDERERPLLWRAGHWAGLLQGGFTIAALIYVHQNDGGIALLFHLIVCGLIVSQIFEYALQIVFLRRSA